MGCLHPPFFKRSKIENCMFSLPVIVTNISLEGYGHPRIIPMTIAPLSYEGAWRRRTEAGSENFVFGQMLPFFYLYHLSFQFFRKMNVGDRHNLIFKITFTKIKRSFLYIYPHYCEKWGQWCLLRFKFQKLFWFFSWSKLFVILIFPASLSCCEVIFFYYTYSLWNFTIHTLPMKSFLITLDLTIRNSRAGTYSLIKWLWGCLI